jgi:phage gp36-like protein
VSYATPAEFEARWGEEALILSQLDNPNATAVNPAVLQAHLDDASGWMDGYLWRYDLPLSEVPAALRSCCLDVSRYRAYRDVRDQDDVRKRFEDWVRWLDSVAAGKVKLGVAGVPPAEVPGGGLGVIEFKEGDRGFSRGLECF